MPEIKILTLQEVAHKLEVSYTQVRVLVLYDEKIPSLKVGSRGVRVKVEDLEAYITSTKQKKEEKTPDAEITDTREMYTGHRILKKGDK